MASSKSKLGSNSGFKSESKSVLLESLKEDILFNFSCALKDASSNLVFGRGCVDASLFLVGEAPGAREDEQGLPFVGSAGRRLDEYLEGAGISLSEVYIANVLKYRPPNNRNPSIDEIGSHAPFLIRQIKIIRPKIICTLGAFSSKLVLAGFDLSKFKNIGSISSIRGKVVEVILEGHKFLVVPTFHPAAAIYNRKLRPFIEQDLKLVAKLIEK